MRSRRLVLLLLASILLCAISALWLDAPVMRFFARHNLIYQQPLQIPVYGLWAALLLPAVALGAAGVALLRRRPPPRETAILALAGLAILAAAGLIDGALKPLFGRSSIADFFRVPPRYGFFFFNGDFDGTFPSGHAAMGIAFLAVLWRFYPRQRLYYAIGAALLMASLVVTRDHFLSDVLAGALVGLGAGAAVSRLAAPVIGATPAAPKAWR